MEYKALLVGEIKADVPKNRIEGHGSVFDVVDAGRDRVRKGAFTRTIGEYGPDGSKRKGRIKDFWAHREAIGTFEKLEEDSTGLFYVARIDETQRGKETLLQVKSGTLDGSSIGYRTVASAENENDRDPKTGLPIRDLLDVDLFEVSQLALGMLDVANSRMAKTLGLAGLPQSELLEALVLVGEWAKGELGVPVTPAPAPAVEPQPVVVDPPKADPPRSPTLGEGLQRAVGSVAIRAGLSPNEVRRKMASTSGVSPSTLRDAEAGLVVLPDDVLGACEKVLGVAPGSLKALAVVDRLKAGDGCATSEASFWAHDALRRAEALCSGSGTL